jgi:DNA-binding response OmpR family regulator
MTCVVVARVTAAQAAELLAAGAFDVIDPDSDFRHLGVRIAAAAARAGTTSVRIPQGIPETDVPGIFVDAQRHLVFIDGKPLDLAANEFRMIEELVSARGGIVTRGQLFKMVSRNAEQISHRALDSHIYGLRHKLGQYADCLQTVRGLGFRLTTPGTIHGSSESTAKSA